MKTFTQITGLLLLIFMLNTTYAAIIIPSFSQSEPSTKNSQNTMCVQAKMYNGEYIPVVDLPIVEIIATKKSNVTSGYFLHGNIILKANLPMIEITESRMITHKLPAFIKNGETIGMVGLPIIEITSEFPLSQLVAVNYSAISGLPVINLPEIVVTDSFSEQHTNKNDKETRFIPDFANLELTKYQSGLNEILVTTSKLGDINSDNVHWIYVTLKRCGISGDGKAICEIIDQTKTQVGTVVSYGMNRLTGK